MPTMTAVNRNYACATFYHCRSYIYSITEAKVNEFPHFSLKNIVFLLK